MPVKGNGETSTAYLRRMSKSKDPITASKARSDMIQWARFLRERKANLHNPDRSKRLGNRALWDLLTGFLQRGKSGVWTQPGDSTITFSAGGQTFTFNVWAEAQARRGRAITQGAHPSEDVVHGHRVPQVTKWENKSLKDDYPLPP